MEPGEPSGSGISDRSDEAGKLKADSSISPPSAKTLSKIQKNMSHRRFHSSVRYIIHDSSSPGYEWLLPGWLAEERHMASGRVYRVIK